MDTDNKQSFITSFASSVGARRCDATTAGTISQHILTIMAGDMLQ